MAFADLQLVVVDEQHRFGVAEREALAAKGRAPHVLLMTATPIPRTPANRSRRSGRFRSAHAAAGPPKDRHRCPPHRRADPSGRRPARGIAPAGQGDCRGPAWFCGRAFGRGGRQRARAPLARRPSWSARSGARRPVADLDVPVPQIEIVHGQMNGRRDAAMDRFRRGEAQLVVRHDRLLEVGVDVPEATVMLILDADRFGVAQLHQLRGRVGRSEAASYGASAPRSATRRASRSPTRRRRSRRASTRWSKRTTGSSWPSSISSSAARASCWA